MDNQPDGHACMHIWQLPQGPNVPLPATEYLTSLRFKYTDIPEGYFSEILNKVRNSDFPTYNIFTFTGICKRRTLQVKNSWEMRMIRGTSPSFSAV